MSDVAELKAKSRDDSKVAVGGGTKKPVDLHTAAQEYKKRRFSHSGR